MSEAEYLNELRTHRISTLLGILSNITNGELIISPRQTADYYFQLFYDIDKFVDIYGNEFMDLVIEILEARDMKLEDDE